MTESFNSKYSINNNIFNVPWHKNEYPEPDDIIIGYINKIEDTGLSVFILDYQKKEALMPLQELSRKKISSIRTLFKEGDIKPLLVLRVDNKKGFIDLSNKYINMARDEIDRLEKYTVVIRIFYQWLHLTKKLEQWNDVMSSSVWLYSKTDIYNHLIDIKTQTKEIKDIFPNLALNDNINSLLKLINDNINYTLELELHLKLIVWESNAINIIKEILKLIENDFGLPLHISVPPNYTFLYKSSDKNKMFLLKDTLEELIKSKLINYENKNVKYNIKIDINEKN